MRPPALTAYVDAEHRRRLRRLALELGLSLSRFVGLAALLVAAQVEAELARGMAPERLRQRLEQQAGVALAERH